MHPSVQPFLQEALGNSSYLIDLGGGRAALIDPDRSVERYLQAAAARRLQITTVFETHLHADFLSGATEIARATGAELFLASEARSRFPHRAVEPGETVRLDGMEFEAVGSPGHTPEHLSYLMRTVGHPPALFSGGALIVGGAARTDLIDPALTESLTRALFMTLTATFAALPDATLLYPTHGAGSFCSTGTSHGTISTLGAERAANPLFAFADEGEFVRWFPTTFLGTPAYYSRMRALNQAGPRPRNEIPPPPPLSPTEFDARRSSALVVDVRPFSTYMASHIPGAFSDPFRPDYAVWLGWVVPAHTPLLFVTDGVPLADVLDQSLLVGYERFLGWLDGGMDAWVDAALPLSQATLVDAAAAQEAVRDGALPLDVREPNEFAAGHVAGALHIPLGSLRERLDEVPRDRPLLVYCGRGSRAASAVSILEREGRGPLLNIDGGFDAWQAAAAR